MTSPSTKHVREDALDVAFQYSGREATVAHVTLRRWTRAGRLRRALQGLFGCWLAAIVAVFLPLLHFILVPSLLLGGPVFALIRWAEPVTLVSARGTCPGCGQEIVLDVAQRASSPMGIRCDHCSRTVQLDLPAEALKAD